MTEGSGKLQVRTLPSNLIAALPAASSLAAPLSFTTGHGLSFKQAFANGNRHGNGHESQGNGHTNGNSNAGGNGNGNGSANANGNGSPAAGKQADLGHAPEAGLVAGQAEEDSASGLGALNAARASPRALANASPNSEVGRVETYKQALDRYLSDLNAGARSAVLSADITATGIALAAAANKTVTTEAVDQLNDLRGASTASDPNWESRTSPGIVAVANGP
jgi:hypothetical protein